MRPSPAARYQSFCSNTDTGGMGGVRPRNKNGWSSRKDAASFRKYRSVYRHKTNQIVSEFRTEFSLSLQQLLSPPPTLGVGRRNQDVFVPRYRVTAAPPEGGLYENTFVLFCQAFRQNISRGSTICFPILCWDRYCPIWELGNTSQSQRQGQADTSWRHGRSRRQTR